MEFWDPPPRPSKMKKFWAENEQSYDRCADHPEKAIKISFAFSDTLYTIVIHNQIWGSDIDVERVWQGVSGTIETRILSIFNFDNFQGAFSRRGNDSGEKFQCFWREDNVIVQKQLSSFWDLHIASRDWRVFMGSFPGFDNHFSGMDISLWGNARTHSCLAKWKLYMIVQ